MINSAQSGGSSGISIYLEKEAVAAEASRVALESCEPPKKWLVRIL